MTKPVLIAEIAKEHGGDLDTAKQLISMAAEGGADVVKFQAYDLKDLNANHKNYKRYKKCHLSIPQLKELKSYATSEGLDFYLSCFSISLLDDIARFNTAIKVPSTFLCYKEFVDKCIDKFDEIHLSTGMYDSEIASSFLSRYMNASKALGKRLIPYHCVSEYPAINAKLSRLSWLRKWNWDVGYSDHTSGNRACIVAWHRGAKFIEKHFTLYGDSLHAITLEELKDLSNQIKLDLKMLEYSEPSPKEQDNQAFYKTEFIGLGNAI